MISDLTLGLFAWWIISISWSIVFLIVAGLYLYKSSRPKIKDKKSEENKQEMNEKNSNGSRVNKVQFGKKARNSVKDFIFVWFLLGLLVFYIFSVQLGTGLLPELVFALGNVVVEALLIFYLVRNRDKSERSHRNPLANSGEKSE